MTASPPSPSSSSPTSSTSPPSPPSTVTVTTTPPTPALLAYETIRFSHSVLYNKTECVAFLTSHRILILATSNNRTLFAIPTSILTGHNISAAKSPQLMMRILYVPPPSTIIPPTPSADAGAAKQAIMQFVSSTALDDRQMWKEAVAQIQAKNLQQPGGVNEGGPASPSSASPTATPAVKQEPGAASASNPPASTTSASPSSTLSTPPIARSSSPTPSPSPSPTPSITTTTISLATLEMRASLLARLPHLKQLHSDLVLKGIISEEEFWSSPSHSDLIRREQDATAHQQLGLSSSMSSDILPSVTSTAVHFKIDANIMHAIFLHSPAVHRAYGQLVPVQMTEKEFWTKYFKSRYVHAGKGQGPAGVAGGKEGGDQFTKTIDDAEKKVEEEDSKVYGDGERRVKALIHGKHVDPSVDLTSADADDAVMTGQPSVLNHDHSNSEAQKGKMSKKSRAQAELVKKFNRHGMLVVEASAGGRKGEGGAGVTGMTVKDEEQKYHSDLNDSLAFKDLQEGEAVQYEVLPLQRKGFFVEAKGKGVKDEDSEVKRAKDVERFGHEVERWTIDSIHTAFPAPDDALTLLQTISLSSRAMNRAALLTQQINARQTTFSLDSDSDIPSSSPSSSSSTLPTPLVFSTTNGNDTPIPLEFQVQLKKHYLTCQELFRHFYSCFPVTGKTSGKLKRIKLALDAAYRGLLMLKGELNGQGLSVMVVMVDPLMKGIEQCVALYVKWEEREKLLQQRQQARQQQAGGGVDVKRFKSTDVRAS